MAQKKSSEKIGEDEVEGVHLTFANTSSGKLTIKISTAKRKDRRNRFFLTYYAK